VTGESEAVAQFVSRAVADPATAADRLGRLRWYVLDNLAAGFLGMRQPWTQKIVAALGLSRPGGAASSFGHPARVDAATAALINGAAIGAFEIENAITGAHPSAAVFPAVFALGEDRGVSGRTFLRALAIAYEVAIRVARAQTNAAEKKRGFHNPSVSGVFGAAAGCSVILDLPIEKIRSAIGIAASHGCGIIEYVWEGAETKRLHCGRAAQLGLESALLADAGLTGPSTSLEGEYGYLQAYSPDPRPGALTENLGAEWYLDEVSIKPYPAHGTVVPFVPVLDQIRADIASPDELVEVVVSTTPDASEPRHLDCAPATVLGAQYSVPYLMAFVLAHGSDSLIDLDARALSDPVVAELATRFVIISKPGATGKALNAGGDVIVTTKTGTTRYAAAGIGPLSMPLLEQLAIRKFDRYSDYALPLSAREEVVRAVRGLAEAPGLADLGRYLAAAADNSAPDRS
jgi:2-methylcitrate dehydratase PrpD